MQTRDKLFLVGIDLCDDFSQISYYNYIENEPISIDLPGLDNKYCIPTVVCKSNGRSDWFAGEEAEKCSTLGEGILIKGILQKAIEKNPVQVDDISVMPIDLMQTYLDYLLQIVKNFTNCEKIDQICITVELFHISLLNVIVKAMNNLGFSREQLVLTSHTESFVYYSISQKKELWSNEVVLFCYDTNGFSSYRMYRVNERGTQIIMVQKQEKQELSDSCKHSYGFTEQEDELLVELAEKVLEKRIVSSVYLVGSNFGEDVKNTKFIKYVCNRRRAFMGHNMFCKGACYQLFENNYGIVSKDFFLACEERITTGIEVRILDRGKDKILRLLKPGTNWFGADDSFDFIVDNKSEIELFLSPMDAKEKQVVKIPLTDFPKRPNKTTRISISISFTNDSRCHLMVKDKGFGEFFMSSGRIINEELLL